MSVSSEVLNLCTKAHTFIPKGGVYSVADILNFLIPGTGRSQRGYFYFRLWLLYPIH